MKDLLTSDHAEIEEIENRLFAAFETGVAGQVFENLDFFWARLAMHIRAEHLHLFPAILRACNEQQTDEADRILSFESVQSAIEELRRDHDFFMKELAAAIKQTREINNNKFQDVSKQLSAVREKVSAVSRRLAEHNKIEETQVYNWSESFLVPAKRAILNEQIQKELDNLPPRFINLKGDNLK